MDSFTSPLAGRSPFSPRSRQSIASKRSVVHPVFRKSSRFTGSGKTNQSIQVIFKSVNNYVERFGLPLPVLITEALTFAERNVVVSARISECGYAWIVCGRRLLVWQYRHNIVHGGGTPVKKQTASSQCYELQLPQSDLAHRAQLVSVYISGSSQTPSCLAVSPEGVVRYWPAVNHEGVSVEQAVDLQGQECDSLTEIGTFGCILATTTCSVVLVQPHLSAGRHSLACHALRPPTGWLGGISKRMSSFIFGPMSTEQSAEARLVRVLAVQENEQVWIVYVLAGHSLQKWKISSHEPEQLIFVTELNRFVQDGFHATVWENCGGDQTETDTWLLDIQSDKDNIILLAAAVNMHVSPQVHYAMISLQTNKSQPPTNIRDFLVLKITGLYREDNPADSLSYQFILCGTSAYLYNQKSVVVIRPQEEPDTLEFNSLQDIILEGSVYVNTPVFFSRNHGLVAVSSNDMVVDLNTSSIPINASFLEGSFNESVGGNLSVYNMDPDEIYSAYKDTVGQLKAAFIFYIKAQQSLCQNILKELFPTESTVLPGIDAALDKVVLEICYELVNDIPAGDPRWNNESPAGLGSSYSMQVLNQLRDKQKAHTLFIKFLHETNLWNRLAAVTVRNSVVATVYVLGELAEKIVCAIGLKSYPSSQILEKGIDRVVSDSEISIENGLTKQDLFFRDVSKVYLMLQELVNLCDEAAHSERGPTEVTTIISETNDLLLTVLKEVMQYRQHSLNIYKPSPNVLNLAPDYLPWISAVGSEGVYDSLVLQQSLTCHYGARLTSDSRLQNSLYDQLVSLVDLILEARKSHLESIKNTSRKDVLFKQYQVDRRNFISPFVIDLEFEKAAILAEKYLDFETLVIICEKTNNQQRLDEYMERFNTEGFSEFVYSWYLQQNQPGKLITRYRTSAKPKNTQKLTNFLVGHPSISWVQNIFDGKYANAAEILKNLADDETELIVRQKTMFSLSKLAKLAAPEDDSNSEAFIDYLDARLELVTFQEDVPDYVLQHYGYDTIKPRVIPPKDLIQLYTCVEYKEANEIDFKKALDLLVFIDDIEERSNLCLDIWRASILRDSWLEGSIDSPLDILQNTLFYKLADLALCLGADPLNILPPLDMVVDSPDIAELQENRNFQYLLKTAYEHIQRTAVL